MTKKLCFLLAIVLAFSIVIGNNVAFSKAGGGKSSGSSGTHTYSGGNKYVSPSPNLNNAPKPSDDIMNQRPVPQSRPSFFRNFLGGLAGAFAGMALFSMFGSLFGFSGANSSVAGFFILLICAVLVIYLIVHFTRKKSSDANRFNSNTFQSGSVQPQVVSLNSVQAKMDVETGIKKIEELFPSFSEEDARAKVKALFSDIQRFWSEKNIEGLKNCTTDEMLSTFRQQLEELTRNNLKNVVDKINFKRVELVDAWVEGNTVYLTYKIDATMLDYNVDSYGKVVEGSNTTEVPFSELWTFVSSDTVNWKLSAINQV